MFQTIAKGMNLSVHFEPEKESQHVIKKVGKPTFLMGIHPHGRYPMDIIPWLESMKSKVKNERSSQDYCWFSSLSDISLAQSSLGKFVPTVGYATILSDVIDVTRDNILHELQNHKSVALFPGGAREMTLCHPSSQLIPLVKRSGFLRLAWGANVKVIPCFLFGMHDSYFCPLARLGKKLFDLACMNIPLWLPTRSSMVANKQKSMVIGAPLDPTTFSSLEKFIDVYHSELESLFEKHKYRHAAYTTRNIIFIDTIQQCDTTTKKRRNSSSKSHVGFAVVVGALLLAISIWYYILNQQWFLFGVGRATKPSKMLNLHIFSASLWTLASVNQFFLKGWRSLHKGIGCITLLAGILMTFTGFIIPLIRITEEPSVSCSLRGVLHNSYHACANMLASLGHTEILSVAVKAAVLEQDFIRHKKHMSLLNRLLLMNFMPRVLSVVFRRVFSPFITDEGIYSMAIKICLKVQLYRFAKNKPARAKVRERYYYCSLVIALLLLLWKMAPVCVPIYRSLATLFYLLIVVLEA